jgi:ATP-binding cassette subfamily A (ABC1) protein 1
MFFTNFSRRKSPLLPEADILGDRIAIMADGQLRCAGSSLFLKKHYGVGYQLTVEKKAPATRNFQEAAESDIEFNCDADNWEPPSDIEVILENIVRDAVPEATVLHNVGTELSFRLPLGAAASFPPMFEDLDREMDKNNIVTYGVSITTLDEVFLLVARGETGEKIDLTSSRSVRRSFLEERAKSYRSKTNLDSKGMFVRHIRSLFRKRALNFKRDKKAWVCSTILPSILVLIGFLLYKFAVEFKNLDALELSINSYNPSITSQPRNPIPFNEPGTSFPCQPGVCMVKFNGTLPIAIMMGNTSQSDLYTFCGVGLSGDIESSCSISESTNIVDRITEAGASGVPQNNTDILSSSKNIFQSSKVFAGTQFGGLHFTHDRVSQTMDQNYSTHVVGKCNDFVAQYPQPYFNASYCEPYGGVGYVVNYNYTALHASLIYQALADEALMREATNDDELTISATVHPLPFTDAEVAIGKGEIASNVWFLVVVSFPFIAGTFATFIVTERSSKAKHLQTVAGVQPEAYWLSSYMWDIMNYQLPLWITVILMFAFDADAYTTTERGAVGGTIITLILFGPAAAGFTYCVSFAFTSPSICNLFVIIFGFLIGLAGPLVTLILRFMGDPSGFNNPSLVNAAIIIEWILRIIPSFNLCNSLLKISNMQSVEVLAQGPITVWDSPAVLYETIMQAVWCFVYIILAIQLDKWSTNPRIVGMYQKCIRFVTCRWMCSGTTSRRDAIVSAVLLDEDVVAENERVAAGEANNDLIVIDRLTKVYGNGKVAVNNLSLGIPPGQCFGLLGINGAGCVTTWRMIAVNFANVSNVCAVPNPTCSCRNRKTTVMGILTGEFPPSSGDATLAGYSVTMEPEKTRRRVGYCPQFDAHFQNMTGREHVQLYANIKGIPPEFVQDAVSQKLEEVGLSDEDSDRVSSQYSGGMKRKLSVACATIGQPQLVFLDEPSTGMDPVARRELWAVISEMVSGGNVPDEERTSVVLTTHSMEECEALCPRIGVMTNGRFSCIGSAQHLKTRFGQGYQVEMKTKMVDSSDEDYMEVRCKLAEFNGVPAVEGADAEEGIVPLVHLSLPEAMSALRDLTNDDSLSSMLNINDAAGCAIYRTAASPVGCTLEELASFAVSEIRMEKLDKFFRDNFDVYVLRERQNDKARYEVGSSGIRISSIFAKIESNKDVLMLQDYGVSQTSLEQVFNMHAAEAERLKIGTIDS